MWDLPPDLRARYRPLRELGRGAFGQVVAARDLRLGREVAIKAADLSASGTVRRRFLREGELLGSIRHPQVVEVYDLVVHGDVGYLVMELLVGATLSHGFGPRPPLELMLEVAGGLQAVHDAGVLHRDLKPDNVLVTEGGRPVLVDFGLAFRPARTRLTEAGRVVGTLAYMAPELLRGERATRASDWYAWGATLYCALEGVHPFRMPQVLAATQGGSLPAPAFHRCGDPRLRDLVRACLAARPAARPADLTRLRARLGSLAARARRGARTEAAPGPHSPATPTIERLRTGATTGVTSPTRGVGARAATSGRVRGLAACLAALLAAGLLALSLGARGAAPLEPDRGPFAQPSVAQPRADTRPGTSLEEVSASLEAASGWLVDDAGAVTRDHQGSLPRGTRPLLDGDPHAWGPLLDAVAGLGAWAAAAAASSPARWSPAERRSFADLDRRLEAQGALPVFAPLLAPGDLSPLSGDEPRWAGLDRGWAAAARRALDQARRAEEDLGREFDAFASGRDQGHPLYGLAPGTVLMAMSVKEFLEGFTWGPERRARIGAWARPALQRLRHGLACGLRALRVHEGDRLDRLGRELADAVSDSNLLTRTELAWVEPAWLGLDPERSAAEALVVGSLLVTQVGIRKRAKLPNRQRIARARATLTRARRDAGPSSSPAARARAGLALSRELAVLDDVHHFEEAVALIRAQRARVEALAMDQRLPIMATFADLVRTRAVTTQDALFVYRFLSEAEVDPSVQGEAALAEVQEVSLGMALTPGDLEAAVLR